MAQPEFIQGWDGGGDESPSEKPLSQQMYIFK